MTNCLITEISSRFIVLSLAISTILNHFVGNFLRLIIVANEALIFQQIDFNTRSNERKLNEFVEMWNDELYNRIA